MRKAAVLPTADEFFRVTSEQGPPPTPEAPAASEREADAETPEGKTSRRSVRGARPPRPSSGARGDSAPREDQAEAQSAPAAVAFPSVSEGPLEKVTFYLPHGLVRSLEVMRFRMLMEHDLKVNRSEIAQTVLQQAFEDPETLQAVLLTEHGQSPRQA